MQTQDESRLHIALSLGLRQRNDPQISQRSAGWILNGKAVAQEVLAQRTLLATEAADPTLAELVKQLLAIRSRLASLSMTVPKAGKEAEHRQQLETLSQQEQELSRQLGQATGHNASRDSWVEPAAVRKALAKGAVLIEVARFRVDNFKALGKENTWLPPRYAVWLIPAAGQGEVKVVDLGAAEKIEAAVQAAQGRGEVRCDDPQGRRGGGRKAAPRRDAGPRPAGAGAARRASGPGPRAGCQPGRGIVVDPLGGVALGGRKICRRKIPNSLLYQRTRPGGPGGECRAESHQPDPLCQSRLRPGTGPGGRRHAGRAASAAPVEQVASSRGLGSLSSLPRVGRLPGTAQEAAAIRPNVTRYAKAEAVVYEDRFALEGVFKALHGPQVLVLSTHGFFMPDQEAAGRAGTATPATAAPH